MNIIPITLRQANSFVQMFHRHNKKVRGGKFAIGLERESELVGVAIAGRPVSRVLDNGKNCEILRVCVKTDIPNGCSMLYGRIRKICYLMGYEKVYTYTLSSESGSSLRAVNATIDGSTRPHQWTTKSRKRDNKKIYDEDKVRWLL